MERYMYVHSCLRFVTETLILAQVMVYIGVVEWIKFKKFPPKQAMLLSFEAKFIVASSSQYVGE